MNELALTDWFLGEMMAHGPLVLGLAALLGSLGLPVPTPLLLLAAGAMVRQDAIDWKAAAALVLAGTILGEIAAYMSGRLAGGWVELNIGRRFGASWHKARQRFQQHGAMAVYLTRVLLTPLSVPTNIIAGSSGYKLQRFLIAAIAGDLSWMLLYGGLGYLFGSQAQALSQAISRYGTWLVIVAAAGTGLYYLIRRLQQNRQPCPACQPTSYRLADA